MAKRRKKKRKSVDTLTHEDSSRSNIPSAEYQDALDEDLATPIQVAYQRRNPDLDPQLVWRGKDVVNPADLVVPAPPLFIQEKVHPKVLVDDLMRRTRKAKRSGEAGSPEAADQLDLFADFNGLAEEAATTEFYRHEANWANRMILGDSLHVMASLAEREGLRGKVQCIYIDPPYGIKFNSNFQWSTTSRDVRDGKREHITRDPEMVKAFRDTWRDGIHSYLSYLRDRLQVARELLTESGSVFVQIGDENVHRVRSVMEEVLGADNFIAQIPFVTTGGQSSALLSSIADILLWFGRDKSKTKFRQLFNERVPGQPGATQFKWIFSPLEGSITNADPSEMSSATRHPQLCKHEQLSSMGASVEQESFMFHGREFRPPRSRHWSIPPAELARVARAGRVVIAGKNLRFISYINDYPITPLQGLWTDTLTSGFGERKRFVVQTNPAVISRCILLTTDPGDLVVDPTCGSGTTAFVAEQWGRRWITIDTSRVALALARARIMGTRYLWYLLTDSPAGQEQLAEITGRPPSGTPTSHNVRHGFVYRRAPHITLRDIADNAEIDVIWEKHEGTLKPLRERLGEVIGQECVQTLREEDKTDAELPSTIQEWEVPRDFPEDWPVEAEPLHEEFWQLRIQRQKEIEESIARNAEFEYLYDQPYEDKSKVRVAGPFTVESLSPHREVALDDEDRPMLGREGAGEHADFVEVILEHLKSAGVQQAHKEDRINFSTLAPWPGRLVCAEGRYQEGDDEDAPQRRAGIFIGPEFGSVMRQDLVDAAEEAADAGFDVLIACAFAYGPHAADVSELGGLPILKARMNADLHMSQELADTGKGNLFVIFGEPDIEIREAEGEDAEGKIQVEIHGVDVFKPQSGKVVSDNRDGIACWMIDTDYNGQSFFVRHAYFLGQNDPYKYLKTSLKAEIDKEAWATLNSPISRPFPKPDSGRIAVKVINHLGDEVMKVYRVE